MVEVRTSLRSIDGLWLTAALREAVSPWMAKGIEGKDDAEADALLTEICAEIVEAAKGLSYFHPWDPADMVIWDNWRILHSVSGSPPESGRCMHRTTIAGDSGLGRFEELSSAGG